MLWNILGSLLGLTILTLAADKLVEGAAGLARRIGISPLVVGLTIVAAGTSAPELVVSIQASLSHNPGISVGNAVGSNIFNIAAILGISALIKPITCSRAVIRRDLPIMIGVAGLCWFMARDLVFDRLECGFLLFLFVAYTAGSIYLARKNPEEAAATESPGSETTLPGELVRIVLGLAALIWGADILLNNSVALAKGFGISDEVIGLTLVAAGTSMPELATSVIAAKRGQPDIAIGNVVGSNIFNILGILGVAGTILPLEVSNHMLMKDLPVMFLVSLACLPIMRSDWRISRFEGGILLAGFIAYTVLLIQGW